MPDSGGRLPESALRQDPTERTNEGLRREIEHLKELLEGKVKAVEAHVDAQKELTDAKFAASERNVTTAFTAAKEAVTKQEAAFKEQIAAIAETMNVQDRGRGAEIAALSKQVERTDARGGGFSAAGALLVSVIVVAGVLVSIAVSLWNR
jgi:hypothetical protein